MNLAELKIIALTWIGEHTTQLIVTGVVLVLYVILDRIGAPRFRKGADRGEFEAGAASKAIRAARLITGLFGGLVLMVVWDAYTVTVHKDRHFTNPKLFIPGDSIESSRNSIRVSFRAMILLK